jgi:Protein of unknown function (DUF3800)
MLQGAFDESESSGAFVVAGYVAHSADWVTFSERWAQGLAERHGGRRFKMSEIARQWQADDTHEKVQFFHDIIMDHAAFGISIAVVPEILASVMEGFQDERMKSPYFFCIFAMIGQLMSARSDWVADHKIEFVFDLGRSEKAISRAWNEFIAVAPHVHKDRIVKQIQFRDDEHWMPIQAADLKAWWTHRRMVEFLDPTMTVRPRMWRDRPDFKNLKMLFDEQKLRDFRRSLEAGVIATFIIHSDGRAEWRFPGGANLIIGPA